MKPGNHILCCMKTGEAFPCFLCSLALLIACLKYSFGISSNSFALKVIVFVLTNWRRNALRIELRLNPNSSAVFFASSFIFGSVLIKMLAVFILAIVYTTYIFCQVTRYITKLGVILNVDVAILMLRALPRKCVMEQNVCDYVRYSFL